MEHFWNRRRLTDLWLSISIGVEVALLWMLIADRRYLSAGVLLPLPAAMLASSWILDLVHGFWTARIERVEHEAKLARLMFEQWQRQPGMRTWATVRPPGDDPRRRSN